MNERILELAEQAGLKYYNWSTNESNIIDGEFKYPRLEDYKKFAELIVKECAAYIFVLDAEPVSHKSAARMLMEHFGVEE